MAYRIEAGQPIPDEIRRIFGEEIASATKQLTASNHKDRDESVHEARKSLKKLRGLLRLVEPLIGKQGYQKESQELRSIGRKLSKLRDARAVIDIFDAVVKEAEAQKALDSKLVQSIRERLEEHKSQTEQSLHIDEVLQSAITALQSVRDRLDSYQLPAEGFENLEQGLKNVYRRGQKAMKHAAKISAACNFHSWRKRAKDHWYHVRLLGALETAFVETREDDLRKLETWLGDDHNLVVLRDTLNGDLARFEHPKQVRQFLALVKQHGQELREKALDLGKHLYGLKPKRLVLELGKAHEIWPVKPKKASARTKHPVRKQPTRKKGVASAPAPRPRAKAHA